LLIEKNYGSRISDKFRAKIAEGMCYASVITTGIFIGIIILYLLSTGIMVITPEFIFGTPKDMGRAGGIFPGIMGTLYLTFGAIIIAFPIGVSAGIFLSEYSKNTRGIAIVRAGIDNLNGTPSIIFGLFGYTFFVLYFGLGRSLLAGILILSLMVIPTIIRTTEEAARTVPDSYREASLALGSSKWETVKNIVLPSAFPGIITGVVLSIGRAAGETAPILFTAATFLSRNSDLSLSQPVMALPYYIFVMSTNVPGGLERASGAGLVLIFIVFLMYGIAGYMRKKLRILT